MIHENLAHEIRRDAEEVRAALPVGQVVSNQPQIGFVNQGCGLQRCGGLLFPQIAVGQSPQLVIKQRHQQIFGYLVSLVPGAKGGR